MSTFTRHWAQLGLLLFRSNTPVPSPQFITPSVLGTLLQTSCKFSRATSEDSPWTCGVTCKCWPVCGSAKSLDLPQVWDLPYFGLKCFSPFFFFFFLGVQANNLMEIYVKHYLCQPLNVLTPWSSADTQSISSSQSLPLTQNHTGPRGSTWESP